MSNVERSGRGKRAAAAGANAEPLPELTEDSAPGKLSAVEMRRDRETIRQIFETGEYPYKQKIRRKDYENHKAELQIELLKVQEWVRETGQKIVCLFEGRDARRQGRHDQAFHGASQPARRARGRARQADRKGTGPVVFPALCRASAVGRGNRPVRPILV